MPRSRIRPPAWFWIVATLLLLWNVAGIAAWVQQMRLGAEAMGAASEYDRQLYASLPGWYNAVYAVAVFAGLGGTIALFARAGAARALMIASFVAVVIQFGWIIGATDMVAVKGAGTIVFPIVIAVIGAFAIWLSRLAWRRRWLE